MGYKFKRIDIENIQQEFETKFKYFNCSKEGHLNRFWTEKKKRCKYSNKRSREQSAAANSSTGTNIICFKAADDTRHMEQCLVDSAAKGHITNKEFCFWLMED